MAKYNILKYYYISHYSYNIILSSQHIVTLLEIWLTLIIYKINPNLSIGTHYVLFNVVCCVYL